MHDNHTSLPQDAQIGIAPMPAVARILSRFDRRQLQGFIEVAIELVDLQDGDTDLELDPLEANGEEDDEDDEGGGDTSADENEPDFSRQRPGYGAGCSISDPDGEHDGREPEHDAEIETWSHPDDHAPELFIGRRPANANNPPDAA